MHPIPCPRCRRPFAVPPADLGRVVLCPRCDHEFAAPDDPTAPVAAGDGFSPPLVGLAVSPWGIPVLWLAALVLSGVEPMFTFAVPLALAVGLTGLGFGLAATAGWSHGTKIKTLIALMIFSYVTAGGLYFLKRQWAETVRGRFGRSSQVWKEFAPGAEPPYRVWMPGVPTTAETPLPGWDFTTYQFRESRLGANDTFVAAHGPPPAGLPRDPTAWFQKARDALAEATGGEVLVDVEVAGPVGFTARQFVLSLPDGTPRVVRLFRGRDSSFYLAAEGAFFTPDARDVRTFFRSFRVTANGK
ncbi:MAG: hypothetical protein ACRC7O_02695 [Fimbriiglobus sp.]